MSHEPREPTIAEASVAYVRTVNRIVKRRIPRTHGRVRLRLVREWFRTRLRRMVVAARRLFASMAGVDPQLVVSQSTPEPRVIQRDIHPADVSCRDQSCPPTRSPARGSAPTPSLLPPNIELAVNAQLGTRNSCKLTARELEYLLIGMGLAKRQADTVITKAETMCHKRSFGRADSPMLQILVAEVWLNAVVRGLGQHFPLRMAAELQIDLEGVQGQLESTVENRLAGRRWSKTAASQVSRLIAARLSA